MNIPDTMTAIKIATPGGPEVLKPVSRPVPQAGEGEVLIKVHYAGVNRPDCLQRLGNYNPPPGASEIPGLEISGEVVAAGDKTLDNRVGEEVIALVTGGGYAEYVVAHHGTVLPVPDGFSMEMAAAIPETFFTVWHNVFQRGQLKAGERFLIHGGTSGIGTTAIQLAKAFGATVIATAGNGEKVSACLELGCDHAINYREEDFVSCCREITQDEGVDLVLDMVGGDYIERNYDAAAFDGRIVQIAFLGGPVTKVNFAKLMMKRLTHTGSTLRARSNDFKAALAGELHEQVWPLFEAGKIKPVMDSCFALEEASKAHARMEESGHVGKIMLKVAGH